MAASTTSNRTEAELNAATSRFTANMRQLLHVSHEIGQIASLEPGWDGSDAPALSGLVASRAFQLLVNLEVHARGLIPPPAMSAPIIDGGLQLEWNRDDMQIEVQVAPDGTYGYLLIANRHEDARYEEADDLSLVQITRVIEDAFHQ